MLLHKAIGGGATGPAYFWNIFEVILVYMLCINDFFDWGHREVLTRMLMILNIVMSVGFSLSLPFLSHADSSLEQNHSEVPEKDEDWPTLETIILFRDGVRQRLRNLYRDLSTGQRELTRNIARMLVMVLEHEGWHIEVSSERPGWVCGRIFKGSILDPFVHAPPASRFGDSPSIWIYSASLANPFISVVLCASPIYSHRHDWSQHRHTWTQ